MKKLASATTTAAAAAAAAVVVAVVVAPSTVNGWEAERERNEWECTKSYPRRQATSCTAVCVFFFA